MAGVPTSSDFATATYVLHLQATAPETMAQAREIMKKLKPQGWSEFSHRKSTATGVSNCICACRRRRCRCTPPRGAAHAAAASDRQQCPRWICAEA